METPLLSVCNDGWFVIVVRSFSLCFVLLLLLSAGTAVVKLMRSSSSKYLESTRSTALYGVPDDDDEHDDDADADEDVDDADMDDDLREDEEEYDSCIFVLM
jgi:hypothetical protein